MMRITSTIAIVLLALIFFACNSKEMVNDSVCKNATVIPAIFPDYNHVTIPWNIAPMNFFIEEKGTEFQVAIKGSIGEPIKIFSNDGVIDIPSSKWRKMLEANKGANLLIEVYVKESGSWTKYQPLMISVSADMIDSHLAYRIINVGYILWNKMGLYQRDLTSFNESPIMENRVTEGNCMNCHSFSKQNPEKMMFHMRKKFGGTVIVDGEEVKKVNTKTPYTMAAAAYPSWHPGGKHIAFSVNLINQWFHGVDMGNEVYDKASDIIVYNIETNTITTSPKVSTRNRENLPCWSPDGKYIYYCSTGTLSELEAFNEEYYSLCRIPYDVETGVWGNVDTVLTARDAGGSITFPKVSPDGKWLLYTRSDHGYFTIFNPSSDLFLLNLETNKNVSFPFNSSAVDSYHSWSGNSRWVVFSSKRIDGLCTRPYFTHVDENGNFSKPFVMPQKDPLFYRSFKNNYNVPELVNGPVTVSKPALIEAARSEGIQAEFDKNIDVDGLSGASKMEQAVLH